MKKTVANNLRTLYEKYGYLPYKMSKFEEYDLYARNKEFLDGARIVTFNDTDGKLLALKPDITLSIVKNDQESEEKRKVYYNETVYRVKDESGFKELLQTGLECIGEIDLYDEYETLYLAAASLQKISEDFVLDISHRELVTSLLSGLCKDENFSRLAMGLIAEKNTHGILSLCESYGVNGEKLATLVNVYGTPDKTLASLEKFCENEEMKRAYKKLEILCSLLKNTEFSERIRLDFSVVGSGNYYDGIVFNGFIDGIGETVLSGGRYDRLLSRMGKKSGAIGFAVYLDLLERLDKKRKTEDVDVVVLYDDSLSLDALTKKVKELVDQGNTVSAQKKIGFLRAKRIVDLRGGGK